MLIEDQRYLQEDLERLEQAISDRVQEEPRHVRDRLDRDHQIAGFLSRIQDQSQRLIDLYADGDGARGKELQTLATGDPFEEFYKQLSEIKDFHRRYPNEPVENLERAYKRKPETEESLTSGVASGIDNLFAGEEAYGRFFDLNSLHEQYLNLPGIRGGRRLTYLQYLDVFDIFTPPQCPTKRADKLKDEYFHYVGNLASYLENFMKRTRPLEDLDRLFADLDKEFQASWHADKVPGWSISDIASKASGASNGPAAEGTGEGIWCPDCGKEFKNENVYKSHLSGKKHIQAAKARASSTNGTTNGHHAPPTKVAPATAEDATLLHRLKERAVAEREYRVHRLASSMQTERSDTRVNVERRQGMTERERQQELEALYAESSAPLGGGVHSGGGMNGEGGDDSGDDDDKIYNPLKLPLSWDGKPIPFWLYKLHGLGVEYPCEICGNFVYMGRRAFEKHFNEVRHIYGLKCLGITSTSDFRDITSIEDAQKLWGKRVADKKKERGAVEGVVQMEDGEGNVMPEKVYLDLQKQGLV